MTSRRFKRVRLFIAFLPGDLKWLAKLSADSASRKLYAGDLLSKIVILRNRMSNVLQASEFLDCFLDRFQLLDIGIHRMFFEVHVLCSGKNFCGIGARNNNYAVGIGGNDITGGNRNAVADHRNICASEAIMSN